MLIHQQLKQLRRISPDPAFLAKSKEEILSLRKKPVFGFPSFKVPVWLFVSASAVAIFVLSVSFSFYFFLPKPAFSALDVEKLKKEFENLEINIQLREIKYDQSVNQTINSAISEISNIGPRHLNNSLLEQEKASIENNFNDREEIKELLDILVE
jgi:hypothetical protein